MDQNNQKDANVSASPLKRFNSQLMNVRTQGIQSGARDKA